MNSTNNIISSWTKFKVIETDFFEDKIKGDSNHFNIVYGLYNHRHENDKATPFIGLYLDNHPVSHGKKSPMTIPYYVAMDILNGMLIRATHNKDLSLIKKVQDAIIFMVDNKEDILL